MTEGPSPMDHNDRRAIEGLFDKLSQVERQSPPRDTGAEQFIAGEIARQPAAPYYMAQTIVMQEHALTQAQARIEELEGAQEATRQGAGQGGGLFSRMFGGGQAAPQRRAMPMQQPQGGGFLAGAAQTAMGVAGGVLLGNAVAGMFAGDATGGEELAADEGVEDMGVDDETDWG